MKKIIKLFSVILICLLMICGCKDKPVEEDPNNDPAQPPIDNNQTDLSKNIVTNELALFNGEFNDRTIVLKVQNNNTKPVYLNYSFEVYDKNKQKLYNKEVYVRVGAKDSAYVVAIQDLEEKSFESYSYNMTVLKDELEEYGNIKHGIKSDFKDNGKEIIVSLSNTGTRTTTVYGWLLFYNNNKLVAVKEVISYNLIPYKTDNISVSYPIKTITTKIPFDKVYFEVNEVSTEL